MPIINFTKPFAVLIAVVLFLLTMYLSRETKKPWIIAILLFGFLGILIGHTVEFLTIAQENDAIYVPVVASVAVDLVFVFVSFLVYLWIDDIAAKEGKRKSIDNSLEWFWNKV